MSITGLPQATVHLLKSGQVISCVSGATKELIENSLDAGATAVEIRLEDFGFTKLEVKDNGQGVEKSQVPLMVAPHTTSKISTFSDLEGVSSYGFRGEALSSLCSISNLKITTKTRSDLVASTFSFSHDFSVKGIESQAGRQGTTVTAANIFTNLPVRRNYFKDMSRRKEELRRIEKTISAFAIINPGVRFTLHHNKSNVFSKIACANLSQSYAAVMGQTNKSQMFELAVSVDPATGDAEEMEGINAEPTRDLQVSMILPKKTAGVGLEFGRTNLDKTFIFVNKRPVEIKEVEKLLKKVFSEAGGLETDKYPVGLVSIEVGKAERKHMDANLEPNKQKVGLGCLANLLVGLDQMIRIKYGLIKPSKETEECNAAETSQESVDETVAKSCFTVIGGDTRESLAVIEESGSSVAIGGNMIIGDNSTVIGRDSDESLALIGRENTSYEENNMNDSEHTVSQFFSRTQQSKASIPETKSLPDPTATSAIAEACNFDLSSVDIEIEDEGADQRIVRRERSPVLKAEMFVTPDLPGLDAVYLNRLKDGDFTEVDPEDFDLISDDRKPRRNNPFIHFESEEGSERLSPEFRKVSRSAESGHVQSEPEFGKENIQSEFAVINSEIGTTVPSVSAWATGRLLGEDNQPLQPVQLLQPPNLQSKPKPALGSKPESRKRKLDETTPRIDLFLEKSAKKSKESLKEKIKTVSVSFSIAKCRRVKKKEEIEDGIIGSLDTEKGNIWLYSANSEINLLHPARLKERMVYDRMLASHPIQSTKIPEPILIHPGHLDDRQATTILSLYTNTRQCPARITDRRVMYNGFDLAKYDHGDNNLTIKLEGRNPDIQFFGLSDLLETLDLISESKEDKLATSRPSKVRAYLRDEATRINRDAASRFTRKEVAELLVYSSTQPVSSCPHNKPLSTCLHEIL